MRQQKDFSLTFGKIWAPTFPWGFFHFLKPPHPDFYAVHYHIPRYFFLTAVIIYKMRCELIISQGWGEYCHRNIACIWNLPFVFLILWKCTLCGPNIVKVFPLWSIVLWKCTHCGPNIVKVYPLWDQYST